MTILFKELAGSPTETYGSAGMKAQRRLLCAYEDRLAAVAVLLGQGSVFGGRSPASYPGPSDGGAPCEVRVEPFEKRPDDQGEFVDLTSDLNNYSNQFALLVVSYEMVDPSIRLEAAEGPAGHDPQLSHGLRRRVHPPARTRSAMGGQPGGAGAAGRRAHAADPHRRAPRHLAPRDRSALGRHPRLRGRGQRRRLHGRGGRDRALRRRQGQPRVHRPGAASWNPSSAGASPMSSGRRRSRS